MRRDITERLRDHLRIPDHTNCVRCRAADEISRLRRQHQRDLDEIVRLRQLLRDALGGGRP